MISTNTVFKSIPGFYDYVKSNAKGKNNRDLTELVNGKFDLNLTFLQVKNFKRNHKISSGMRNHYGKGICPPNAIKKGQRISIKTEFKKGSKPKNTKPLGSELLRKDGYWWIKISDEPGPHNLAKRWITKARHIWEQANGPIPEGYVLLHLDGVKRNDDLSNLLIVKKSIVIIMTNFKLLQPIPEATKTGVAVAELIQSTTQKTKILKERMKNVKNT